MSSGHGIDEVSGTETTGHEWDGIRELNTPLPRWWQWVFYVCIAFAVGYWILYPAWPALTGYSTGMLGYSQRQTVSADVAAAKAAQVKFTQALASASVDDVRKNPELLRFALAGGRAAFATNCAPCHGRGAEGRPGYPNLNDDDWLWGGKLDDIVTTISAGVRSTSPSTRQSQMPRFGLDKLLEPAQINDAGEFVLSLSNHSTDAEAAKRGKQIFADNCVACHGDAGKGKQDVGAPNLTDAIWLYGGTKPDIVKSIETGRGGVMPSWQGRLDAATIKELALYVHQLGGGK
jgi:cytochrome c oxidase cbb3-type subunit III